MLAGVSRSTIKDFECHRHALHRASEDLLVKALEEAGCCCCPETEGPGVRLRHNK